MRRYIRADLRRIFTRVPRWILLAAAWILAMLTSVIGAESLSLAAESADGNFTIFAIVFGIIEIIFIYGDDFKAKSMQMAIGTGMPRQKVIHAKLIEFMITMAFDLAVEAASSLLTCVIWLGTEGGFGVRHFFVELFMAWLIANAYLASIMFFMYWMQGISLTLLIYVILGCNVVPTAVKAIGSLLKLTKFHLQSYTITAMLQALEARLLMGHFSWFNAIGILIYMAIGFALARIIFKRKELEF